MNWKISSERSCLIFAHRGDTKAAVENTLSAIDSALRMGVDGVEVDLRLTRDGEIVLFHDDNLMRLTGLKGKVEDRDLNHLKTVALGRDTIATLRELLDLVRDRALLNLEIKTVHFRDDLLEKKLLESLKSFSLHDSVLVTSFHPLPLWKLKRLAPTLPRGYLFENKLFLHDKIMPFLDPFSVNAPLAYASKSLSDAVHRAGRRFFIWTVNDEDDIKRCIDLGVDGLITDEPQKLLNLLKRGKE